MASAAMSFQQKKKIIDKFVLDENTDVKLEANQKIVMYLRPGGVNIHHVIPLEYNPDLQAQPASPLLPESESFLVTMPKKYRGLQYLKKNDLLIVDNIEEGKKVLGEIKYLISKEHVTKIAEDAILKRATTK